MATHDYVEKRKVMKEKVLGEKYIRCKILEVNLAFSGFVLCLLTKVQPLVVVHVCARYDTILPCTKNFIMYNFSLGNKESSKKLIDC